jgi:hypothetical protein
MQSGKSTEDLPLLSHGAGNFWKRKSALIPGLLNYLETNTSALASSNRTRGESTLFQYRLFNAT